MRAKTGPPRLAVRGLLLASGKPELLRLRKSLRQIAPVCQALEMHRLLGRDQIRPDGRPCPRVRGENSLGEVLVAFVLRLLPQGQKQGAKTTDVGVLVGKGRAARLRVERCRVCLALQSAVSFPPWGFRSTPE